VKLRAEHGRIHSMFLESNFMGLTTMLTTCLLSVGGSFKSAGQVHLSDSWIALIDSCFNILEKLCHYGLNAVQQHVSPPTELYHLFLYSINQFHAQKSPKLAIVVERVIRLVGYVIQFHLAILQ
jgi:hypothetical protein